MSDLILTQLFFASREMGILLTLRLLPFATYSTFRRASTPLERLAVALGYLTFPTMACALGAERMVPIIVAGCAYYLVVCLAMNHVRAFLSRWWITRGALFGVVFFAFLLLPGALAPRAAYPAFLVVGWELVMSSYSYCVDTCRPGATAAPVGECLFFLLVNPTLVYTARGKPADKDTNAIGWVRATGGAALMFANVAAMRPLARWLHRTDLFSTWPFEHTVVTAVLGGSALFLTFYAANSALASLQIGLMRSIGWSVPERYEYPLLSTSPMDFWRRWNVYVRVWLEAYIFFPLARRIARKTRKRGGQAVAAIVTLTASGMLHDAYVFAGSQKVTCVKTEIFLTAGVLLAIWRVASLLGERARVLLDAQHVNRFNQVIDMLARVSLGGAVVAAALVWS